MKFRQPIWSGTAMSASFLDKHRLSGITSPGETTVTRTAKGVGSPMTASPTHGRRTSPLDRLIFRLVKYRRPLRMHEMVRCLRTARLQSDDLLPVPPASGEGPVSWTLYENHFFEIRCLTWLRGQRSSIHDHCGSRCCVYVVEGVLTNVDFRRDSRGGVRQVHRCRRVAGEILRREHREIHQIANEHPRGKRLVTLHLYSPPLSSRRATFHAIDR